MNRIRVSKDAALIVVATAAACILGLQVWLISRSGEEIDRLRHEQLSLSASLKDHERSVHNLFSEKTKLVDSIADSDLSRFPPTVAKEIQRLEDPKLWSLSSRRSQLDRDYAALFGHLRLSTEKLNSLRDLLAIRTRAETEALRLAMADGVVIDEAPDRVSILAAGTEDVDESIKQLLGDRDFAEFAGYQATVQIRKFVLQPFADHLHFGAEPLNGEQIEQLVASVPPYYFGVQQYFLQEPAPELPKSMDDAAQHVLSEGQLKAYQQYKQVWECRIAKERMDLELFSQQHRATSDAPAP